MIDRYSRQTLFPGIGEEGQQKLGSSRVVIIGCGALGTIIATSFPLGTIRLSPGYFNTMEEVDFTVEAIKKITAAEALTTVGSTALEN